MCYIWVVHLYQLLARALWIKCHTWEVHLHLPEPRGYPVSWRGPWSGSGGPSPAPRGVGAATSMSCSPRPFF